MSMPPKVAPIRLEPSSSIGGRGKRKRGAKKKNRGSESLKGGDRREKDP
jgi:hypothetical protein